jgi:hypothetical protein
MNKNVKFVAKATVVAAALSLAGTTFAAAVVDANIELDNTSRDGNAVAAADKGLSQSGRLELNISNKTGADVFVAGRASFLALKNGNVGTDDMWLQIGSSTADVKLGRFEAADLFPLAGDTLINHAGAVYLANSLRGRKGSDVFHAAGTYNIGSGLSFELGVIQTTTNTLIASTARGIRPVLSYVSGPVSVRLGLEQGNYNSGNKISGYGLTASYDAGSIKFTGNASLGKQDATVNETQGAYGLTAAMGGLVVGAIVGKNDQTGGEIKVQTGYVSYAMPLLGVKGATITPALSLSKMQNSAAKTDAEETSFRVRLNYVF